mgnify:CR=1 FL=1
MWAMPRSHIKVSKYFDDVLTIQWKIANRTGVSQAGILALRNTQDNNNVSFSDWAAFTNTTEQTLTLKWPVGLDGGIILGDNNMVLNFLATKTTPSDAIIIAKHVIILTLVE